MARSSPTRAVAPERVAEPRPVPTRENPFRVPWPWRVQAPRSTSQEFAHHVLGRASRSRTRSACRALRLLAPRRAEFDLIHDNQCLGTGLLGMMDDGWPVRRRRSTTRSPSTATSTSSTPRAPWRAVHPAPLVRRSSSMQMTVARQLPRLITVSRQLRRRHRRRRWACEPTRSHRCRSASTRSIFRPLPAGRASAAAS